MQILLAISIIIAVVVYFWRRKPREQVSFGKLPAGREAQFLQCAFSMLGKIAGSDGRVSSEEEKRVREYMEKELLLPEELQALAIRVFKEAVNSPLEMRDYTEHFRKSFPDSVQLPAQLIEILVDLSLQDGYLHPSEESNLKTAALLLGITKPAFESIMEKKVKPSQLSH